MTVFFLDNYSAAMSDANKHAISSYPNESCGVIYYGKYIPLENICRDSENEFEIDITDYIQYEDGLEAIVHSHPDTNANPSQKDMESQIATGVVWVIISVTDGEVSDVCAWGGNCAIEPVLGRKFRHGVSDCYSLIRDVYRLGNIELANQGISWPFPPIDIKEFPRNNGWWKNGEDLYVDGYTSAGFTQVTPEDVNPGDVFLTSIQSDKLNHGGVLLSDNNILHHLPMRLSRREGVGIWSGSAKLWLRYKG